MPQWRKKLVWGIIMIQRRLRNGTVKMIHTPSQIIALVLILFILCTLWLDFFIETRDKYQVKLIKHDKIHSVFPHRPVKKDLAVINEKSDCSIYQFKPNLKAQGNVTCKRLKPVPGSCDIAREIFELPNPNPATCSFQDKHHFCHVEHTKSKTWTVLCDFNVAKVCLSGLKLGLPSDETGELVWETYQNTSLLEKKLTDLVQGYNVLQYPPHYGFAFIGCDLREKQDNSSYYYYDQYTDDNSYAEQLIILPPFSKRSQFPPHTPTTYHGLNLNVILVDSVSHQHLFRSLPKTVSVLEEIASKSVANVFNFELFHAIKSRTFETLQTIFSGYVNVTEKPFGRYAIPTKPLNLAPIYKPLRNRGYRTLWLEDLCYLWEWGISKDLRFLKRDSSAEETWKRMWLTLKDNGVDSIDITISMCRLLNANRVRDHFHGPDAVCFNGKHQHEYILEYLRLYHTEMNMWKQPFFTMTSTNVGHEPTGKRVQTLDKALADYISFTSSLENTISVIFSDHGNSYGKYFKSSKEAMIELYHPFMFFIIPHSAATLLGKDMMNSLMLNTKRLITALDVHYTLFDIVDLDSKGLSKGSSQKFPVNEKGLLEPVDPDRDCYNIPRLKPNVCICQSLSTPLEATSFASLFAYLALGALNDEIQFLYSQSFNHSSTLTAFGNCEPLYLSKITDIKEISGPGGQRFFQMNIHVQQSQIFFVSITMTTDKQRNTNTFLESYSRMTNYGVYSNCSDPSVEPALCICDMSKKHESQQALKYTPNQNTFQKSEMNALPSFDHVVTPLKNNLCFYIFTVRHKDGDAIFGINECKTIFTLKVKINNLIKFVYFYKKEESVLLPGGVAFLGLIVSEIGESWVNSVKMDFIVKKR